jgi:ribosome-associated protein
MDIRRKQRAVVEALEDIKGRDVVVYDVSRQPSIFERVIIATGDSTRQVAALAGNVQEKLKAIGAKVYGVEGERSSDWVLVDLGDVVVHVMHPTVRANYNLEEIWGVKPVRLRAAPPAAGAARKKAPRKPASVGAAKKHP